MKRTQLYMDEDIFRTLKRVGRERSVTISQLVREALQKTYGREKPADAASILREAAGIWKDRKDLGATDDYVRSARKDTRRERFGLRS